MASRRVRPLRLLVLLVGAAVLPAVSPSGALERRLTRQAKRRASVPVGADDRSAADHAVAVDVIARAAAALAAADAAGASAPTSVPGRQPPSPGADGAAVAAGGSSPASLRGRRAPSPAPPDVCAGARSVGAGSVPASPPSPSSPNAAVPAVTYNLPKYMGSSLGWTDEDRVPLCRAYLEVSEDPVTATSRSKDQLWAAVHEKWTDLMTKKGTLRVNRNVSALEKQFKKIRKGVSTFTSHYLAVKNMQTTGNLTEEDIISGAVARYCSLDIYESIRNDREKDKRKGKAAKRKAKLAHCKWVGCWRVLRTSDKFSGSANTADDASVDLDDSSDEDGESGSTSSPSTRNKGYQRRPGGIKAAKLMRSEDASMERQVKASTAAVDKLTVAQQERTALCFFDSPAMRHTPEAAKYRQAVMRKMMQAAGLAAPPAPAPSPAPPAHSAVDEINVVEVDDGVADMDVTPPAADASSSAPPAAGSAAGANAPPGEDPPAAPVAADTAGTTALAAEAASPAAPPARGNGGGDNQRGRKSQAAKQRAASAALSKQLDTTRGLDHSSESDTTTTTTEDTE